ncbi:MAG: alpha-hydroxy acid oxidase [Methylophilaceae bacterium]
MQIEKTLNKIPNDIIQASDYEVLASRFIEPATLAYIAGGSADGKTMQKNLDAFNDVELLQRALVDCTQGTTQTTLLGQTLQHPIMLAPVAAQKLVHPEGEIATAQAANALEAGMIASTLSSASLEEIAKNTQAAKWFQLYFQSRKNDTLQLIKRAEQAGYQAIVVTVDAPVQTISKGAQTLGFQLTADAQPINLAKQQPIEQVVLDTHQSVIFQGMMREAPLVADIAWLKSQTKLPVLIKGVMHPQDIAQLLALNIDGIIVSNHGGRALDATPATLCLLPIIRAQVGKDFPLLLDGGIRSGYDVFKAIALGADAICIGRLQVYALAVCGAKGVAHLLKMLRDELELCMALTGCPTISDISQDAIFKKGQ